MTSAATTVPDKVQLVAVSAVIWSVSAGVVMSTAEHHQPFGAVGSVITGAQAVWPAAKLPVVAPPFRAVGVPQPEAMVKVAPFDMWPDESIT